jgi:hypothetical protein
MSATTLQMPLAGVKQGLALGALKAGLINNRLRPTTDRLIADADVLSEQATDAAFVRGAK